ncbi:ATP-binding protein [Haloarchaeobius amylolyticus]|uniref:ATP-binding protein n=1 Tax=Haloarchaeobius amylolyticus TaxID=1198296 RepID=UPI00226D615B|nr:ATP-binding protein [Haloarchaeobius amylolyticus]
MSTAAARDFAVLHEVAQTVSAADTLDDALASTVEIVCQHTDWRYAEVWRQVDGRLELGPTWYQPDRRLRRFHRDSRDRTYERGEGLPGRVWETQEPEWIRDVAAVSSARFHRRGAAVAAGFHAALGVPIVDQETVVAVLVFLLDEPRRRTERMVALVGTVAILGGLFAQKERFEAAARRQQTIARCFEASPVGIVIFDTDGTLVDLNDQAASILGQTAQSLAGTHCTELGLDPVDAEGESLARPALPVERAIEEDRCIYGVQCGITTPTGERWVVANAAPVRDESGRVEQVVVAIEDLTSQHVWEQEIARQNERLSRFAGAVSHDLRNPLSTARTSLLLAKGECDSPHLDRIEGALGRMDAIIDDVLSLARGGRAVVDPSSVSLEAVTRAAWASTVNADDATLSVAEDRTLLADEERLQRLLENLFRNAVEHAGPDVTVRVGAMDGGFFVEDDGPGIPEGKREKAFQPGYTTRQSGTGFGLALVDEIACAHDWSVTLTDAATGGARFEFTVE